MYECVVIVREKKKNMIKEKTVNKVSWDFIFFPTFILFYCNNIEE